MFNLLHVSIPSSSCIWLFIIFIYKVITPSLCDSENSYLNCVTPFQCGTAALNLSYPFWGSTRPSYCGHPRFELDCAGEAPILSLMSTSYRVIQINYTSQFLRVARTEYWNDLCPAHAANSTLDSTLFNYTGDTDTLNLFYQCPRPILPVDSPPSNEPIFTNQFACPNMTDTVNFYELKTGTNSSSTVGFFWCYESIVVRVVHSATQTLRNGSTPKNLVAALQAGFGLQWHLPNATCEKCELSGGVCGSNPDTGDFACHCKTGSFASACEDAPSLPSKSSWWVRLVIGISVGLTGIIIIAILIYFYRKKALMSKQVEEIIKAYDSKIPKRYSYAEVKKMTNLFKNQIGRGGYSVVYKGNLPEGKDVAVKILNESKGDMESFMNEVASISKTSHVNVVTLLGFCFEWNKRILVYEYMPKGSLEKYICHRGPSNSNHGLDWNTLYRIVLGIARGLEYLHQGCNRQILHFDIKPNNILLDEDFCPKISDFGLSKQCETKESHVSMKDPRGTPGFIAPEVFRPNLAKVTHKSDVYSFGMLVLEMVGERKNPSEDLSQNSEDYFPNWIYNDLQQSKDMNSYWARMTDEEEEQARKMIIVGLSCIRMNPSERPSMSEVIEMLGKSVDGLQIPPKPALQF